MPGPNWIKSIIKRGKKYIKPIAEKFSLTEDTAKKALEEAKQYKQSEGYKDLLQRSIQEGKQMGLKLGQKYPGDAKMIELLNTQWPEYKANLLPQLQTDTRAGRRHIWQALTGQFYGLGPIMGIGTGIGLNNTKQDKDYDTGMNL